MVRIMTTCSTTNPDTPIDYFPTTPYRTLPDWTSSEHADTEPKVVICQKYRRDPEHRWRHEGVRLTVDEARRAIEFLRRFVSENGGGP